MLNKSGHIPLYIQLGRIIREKIVSGEFKEGEAIPSETELTKQYRITRTTVRKAISSLVQEGLLELVHGKGTFVRLKELKYSVWNFGGFSDFVKNRGEVPISILLDNKIITVDGKAYFQLKRARGVNKGGRPLMLSISKSMISLDKFPNIDQFDFELNSLYDVMRTHYNVYPQFYETVITPTKCNDEAQKVFEINPETYLLNAKVKVTDEGGDLIETVQIVFGPKMEFKMISKMGGIE